MRTIAVTNQKGGVGKTTTVANLGAGVARRGLNVCLIDLDPQAHLTMHFGLDPSALSASMYDCLTADVPLSQAAVLVAENLTVLPAVIDLAAAEVELAAAVGREQILKDLIVAEPLPYDLLLVDCPPSLGLLTLNALAAVEEVLIPLQPHFLALQGLGKLLETVSLVRRRINPSLTVFGVIFCMYERITRLAGEVAEDVQQFFDAARDDETPWSNTRVFRTRVRRNIKLAECPGHGTTIFNYAASSRGAADYGELAEEFLSVSAAPAAIEAPDASAEEAEAQASEAPAAATVDEPASESAAAVSTDEPPSESPAAVPADGPPSEAAAAATVDEPPSESGAAVPADEPPSKAAAAAAANGAASEAPATVQADEPAADVAADVPAGPAAGAAS